MTMSPAGPIAPLARRAIACAIDLAIMALILLVGYGVTAATTLPGLTAENAASKAAALVVGVGLTFVIALVWFVVFCFLQGSGGSVGMRIMKLRLVREGTEAPLGFGRALLRNIVFGLSTAIVVGYFTPLFDGSGRFQGWHDRAAGALMRDARGASAPASAVMSQSPVAVPAALSPQGGLFPASEPGSLFPPSVAPVGPQDGHTGFTLPPAPSAAVASPAVPEDDGSVPSGAVAPAEADPHDATVLSPAAQAAADAAHEGAMITVVPGVSPSVPAPAPVPISGPETVAPARPPVPAAPPASVDAAMALPAVAQPAEDEDLEETRISIPGHRLQFVWDDGARATVSGRTLFGRNPAPEAGTTVVVVRDETLSLSKTHFEAAAEAAGGWVMDRHSTNGMTIVRDGVRIACPPGERVRIRLGDAIEIGDRIVTVGGYA
ncbi:RDD family protein [Microbacterium azadirachtae]|uniref:RDD family protein n=1 Tax=Microbacterium azadirachtae TaxID=582680 RepID=A0A0F0LLK3_9MICO|nr:RDD family protein [Microbacterium azadirachtae]KJL33569.1 RDD family protein [Microbacterium azadirachtae]